MDRQTKRAVKKNSKHFLWFFLIAFPILLIVCYLLYSMAEDFFLKNQWAVIMILVVVGGIIFLIYDIIRRKVEQKRINKLKNDDPYAD